MNSMTHFKISLFTPLRWIRGFGWAFFRSMRLEVIDYSHQSVTEFCFTHLKTQLEEARTILWAWTVNKVELTKSAFLEVCMFSKMYQSTKIHNNYLHLLVVTWNGDISEVLVLHQTLQRQARRFVKLIPTQVELLSFHVEFSLVLLRSRFVQTASKCKARVGV